MKTGLCRVLQNQGAGLLTQSINLITVSVPVSVAWSSATEVDCIKQSQRQKRGKVKQENAGEHGDERHTGRHWINGQAFML